MKNKMFGYMRVSTIEQNSERQLVELLKWGVEEKYIYSDKLSGKNFDRPNYQTLRKIIGEGDILVVKSIDRLGRNYLEIQKEWRYLVKEKKADIVILDMPLLDTRANKDLIGTLISDIVLQLLSYVAQTERENLRQRQAEGIAIAKASGKQFGRKPTELPRDFARYYRLWKTKILTFREFADRLHITPNQARWMVRRYKAEVEKKQPYDNPPPTQNDRMD